MTRMKTTVLSYRHSSLRWATPSLWLRAWWMIPPKTR